MNQTLRQSGERINNYHLQTLLGRGSFGEVWKAKHHIFDQWVAIKIPTDPDYIRNLQREGVVVHGLRHPNIVQVFDIDPFADPPYLVMELIDGPSLQQVIKQHPQGMNQGFVRLAFASILRALTAAHQAGVVHRDIKPANVLLGIGDADTQSTRPDQVKVADFGLGLVGDLTTASMVHSKNLRDSESHIAGTIAYLSPEQRDGQVVDHRSDLYSAGIVLYEMLTGVRPQGSDLPSQLNPTVSPLFDRVFARCHTRLARRYASAEEAISDLFQSLDFCDEQVSWVDEEVPCDSKGANDNDRCPACDNVIFAGEQYCNRCGRQMVDTILRCPACEAHVYVEDSYCIICGRKLMRV